MQTNSRHSRMQPLSRTKGFSLIELMVSLTIGLIIALAAMSAYLGAASSSKMSDAQGRMNEDAQAALNLLAQQIRMAGANPVQPNRADVFRHNPVYDPTYVGGSVTSYGGGTTSFTVSTGMSGFAIRGCDGTFSNITTAANLDALSPANCDTSNVPDSIAVSYEADIYNTVPTSTTNAPTDCVGNSVPTVTASFTSGPATTASFTVADNRFYITNTSTVPSLSCKGIGGTTQPLVENVEDLKFTYGTVSTTATSTTATVAGYLGAADINALVPTSASTYSAAWGKVLAVRICVVVRSDSPVAPNAASGRYYKCDGTLDTSKTDLRLRRAYSTTVVLRNRRV